MGTRGKEAIKLIAIILTGISTIWLSGCGGGASESQAAASNPGTTSNTQTATSGSNNTAPPPTTLANGSQFSLVSSRGTVIEPEPLNPVRASQSNGSTGSATPAASDTSAGSIASNPAATTAQRVIEEDERYPVYAEAYPYRAVALITYNNTSFCSGWLASKDTLVTAGHCVHTNGGWLDPANYRILPGYADGYAPYGSCGAKEIYSSYAWVTNANSDADVGIIKLDCDIGTSTGWLSYLVTTPTSTDLLTISGYPGDKAGGQQQWASQGRMIFSSPGKLYYDNDTYVGMSGSPVWLENGDGTAKTIALHSNAVNTFAGESNAGTRISQGVFDLITAASKLP